jgi:integrase
MSLFKRNKTWWTDFSVNGVRYRLSLDTTDWREAQRLEKERISDATTGKLAPASQQFARLAFCEAADRYLENRRLELSPRSAEKEEYLLVAPRKFFAATSLARIGAEDLITYRGERAKQGVTSTYINMEMGVIRRILKRAKRWHLVADDLRPLKERHRTGRALTSEQKARLLRLAETRTEWLNVKLAQILAFNTTMRGCEIKGLRWRDVDLIERTLTIRRNTTKTDAGERVIPLNANAMAATVELYRRAQDDRKTRDGKTIELEHYLFPACENNRVDPTRPQTSWRTAWRRLTRSVECPKCGLVQDPGKSCQNDECNADISKIKSPTERLRFHDLRHHAITELAESQASDQTIMAIAGHIDPKMLKLYSHVRTAAMRRAVDALTDANAIKGYDTNNDTNNVPARTARLQVFEKMVGPWGLEPQTSTVSR